MLAAYLLALLVTRGHVPTDTAWTWAQAAAATCPDAKTCTRFVSFALAEGGFAPDVLSGACNRRPSRAAPCDNGHAWGPWQVHPEDAGTTGATLLTPLEGTRAAFAYWSRCPGAWSTWRTGDAIARAWLLSHPFVVSDPMPTRE